jgi:DsbC/DsbD-like thiol-disulfide interchange protein
MQTIKPISQPTISPFWRSALAALFMACGAQAQAIDVLVKTDNVTALLVSEDSTVQPGQRIAVMLHQTIRTGWHTYWLNPGDSGQPTAITWQLPDGATADPIQWQTPQPIKVGPLVNYGYSDNVGLITIITVPANWSAGTPFPLTADATWLVCEHECIPESGQFTLSIPTAADRQVSGDEQSLFAQVRGSQPGKATFTPTLNAEGDAVALQIPLPNGDAS